MEMVGALTNGRLANGIKALFDRSGHLSICIGTPTSLSQQAANQSLA